MIEAQSWQAWRSDAIGLGGDEEKKRWGEGIMMFSLMVSATITSMPVAALALSTPCASWPVCDSLAAASLRSRLHDIRQPAWLDQHPPPAL